MAAYNKFNVFVEHLANKIHDLFGTTPGTDCDTCKVFLTDEAPLATDTVKADMVEITAQNGYTAGGNAITNNGTRATGTLTFDGLSGGWTASGGPIGPFRYVVLYNDTPTSPADPVIAWWDRGASLTLQDGETFNYKFNNVEVPNRGTIFTLS